MKIPTKRVGPTLMHEQIRLDLIGVFKRHGDNITGEEMLALTCYLAGQLMAMLDQRKYTPEMAWTLISENIAKGNMDVIAKLMDTGGPRN